MSTFLSNFSLKIQLERGKEKLLVSMQRLIHQTVLHAMEYQTSGRGFEARTGF